MLSPPKFFIFSSFHITLISASLASGITKSLILVVAAGTLLYFSGSEKLVLSKARIDNNRVSTNTAIVYGRELEHTYSCAMK